MNKKTFNAQSIISKLEYFNYKYEIKDETLKIYLPMLCYLKIKITKDKIKFSSHIRFGFNILSLEYNFLIYSLALYLLTWFKWTALNKGIFILLGLFIIYFVISFIKTESMKTILHNWIENEN